MKLSQSNIPLAGQPVDERLGWLREAVQEGRRSLEQCSGFAELDSDLELISQHRTITDPQQPDFYRELSLPLTKARVSDIVSTLSNLRQLWQVSSGVPELQQASKVLNKCSWAWWRKTDADLAVLSALQYSAVQRTGYLWLRYNPHYYGLNQGEMVATPLGPKWVYYLGMPHDYNYQMAYATIVCEVVPLTQARADYPFYADRLKPTTDATLQSYGFLRRMYNRVIKGVDSMMDGAAPEEQRDFHQSVPGVLIYHAYFRDLTRNLSGREVTMGASSDPKYQYKVPFLGQRVPTGMVETATSLDVTRPATPEDTYLYPRRRYCCFTESDILYDGPSKEFHGRAPIVKFTLDPWPWDFLGGSMVRDVRPTDETINKRLRGIDKSAEMRRNPPVELNEDKLAESEKVDVAAEIDRPGGTLKGSIREGDFVRAIHPYQHYDVQSWEYEYVKGLHEWADFISGRAQMEALATAQKMPAGDTQEKFLQLTGARTTAKSRSIERSLMDLGQLVVPGILQYWTAPKRFRLLGHEGVSVHDFDYDPGSLIPSDIVINSPDFKMDYRSDAYRTRAQRAVALIPQFSLDIEPLSAHDLTSMTKQLLYTRLYEGGKFPLDSWTFGDVIKVPNMGQAPETEKDSVPERYVKEQEIRGAMTAAIQARMQMIMMQANPQAFLAQMIQQNPQQVLQMVLEAMNSSGGSGGGSAGGGSNGATGRPEGRPPSYQESPRLFNRSDGEGGERTVLTTSET